MNFDVTPADIMAAEQRIAGRVRVTPTWRSEPLSRRLGVETFVKHEGLQLAGSFKPRGCFNKLLTLTERRRRAASSPCLAATTPSPSRSPPARWERTRSC